MDKIRKLLFALTQIKKKNRQEMEKWGSKLSSPVRRTGTFIKGFVMVNSLNSMVLGFKALKLTIMKWQFFKQEYGIRKTKLDRRDGWPKFSQNSKTQYRFPVKYWSCPLRTPFQMQPQQSSNSWAGSRKYSC